MLKSTGPVRQNGSLTEKKPDQDVAYPSAVKKSGSIEPDNIRFLTATSLFDGHDASINIMRRLLQRQGCEVIHLGHDRSVDEVIKAAIEENVHGIAISSYQGGHNEYFRYLLEQLKEKGFSHIKIFGGGGGVIIPPEIKKLEAFGITKIYSPDDGRIMKLEGIVADMIRRCSFRIPSLKEKEFNLKSLRSDLNNQTSKGMISKILSEFQRKRTSHISQESEAFLCKLLEKKPEKKIPVVGINGVGGAGKSSLIDEFLNRFLIAYPQKNIALLCIDPTQRKTEGALLGDRLRMNISSNKRVFMHSLATRRLHSSISLSLKEIVHFLKLCSFDMIFVESAGVGQSDTELTDYVDLSLYIMTSEYGADTQLEKISMLDYADFIVINKFDKQKSKDALRSVRKQYRRNHNEFEAKDEELPVFGTIASRFNEKGTTLAFCAFMKLVAEKFGWDWDVTPEKFPYPLVSQTIVPENRVRYLSEISETLRNYHKETQWLKKIGREIQSIMDSLKILDYRVKPLEPLNEQDFSDKEKKDALKLVKLYNEKISQLDEYLKKQLNGFKDLQEKYKQESVSYQVRNKNVEVKAQSKSLSGILIPKIAVPELSSFEEIIEFLRSENIPGEFPFTAGVFPIKRTNEDPTRMFAGEGSPERTNRRFHYISEGQKAARLSTAFDSITLYGANPGIRPDLFGKIGNAGVSICTVDDMKKLYSGFDLASPSTSISMTINGPAPMLMAFFLQTAVDQQVEKHLKENGEWDRVRKKIAIHFKEAGFTQPQYHGELPENSDGLGLGFLGVSSEEFVSPEVYNNIKSNTLASVRGTVQADILKEDQAQNTCIFSTEFALKMMGDIQEYFIEHDIANFYSVSISGYHIAEAGANPITQVAFTLANGFTFVEYYLSRGMNIDRFARNLSFFFSNGMDPEYAVIGRVARRIWSIALKYKYKASERSQKLKYHIQTSGRSLHAQEIAFNDIRTTLQALYAVMDNCNSLHTNAYDEAITTPTPESVRRAIAIQLIINHELGLTKNENPLQGSYFLTSLTNMVEDAILTEFDRITERGGVLGAMESMYQRHKIQEESMFYETLKQSGELPIIGVNTYLQNENPEDHVEKLMRSTVEEKNQQLEALKNFHAIHQKESETALTKLKQTILKGENTFDELMNCVKKASLGQVSEAMYEAGGSYRRNL